MALSLWLVAAGLAQAGPPAELRGAEHVAVHPDGSLAPAPAPGRAEMTEKRMLAEVAQMDFGIEVPPAKPPATPATLTWAQLMRDPVSALHTDLDRTSAVSLIVLLLGLTVWLHVWLCSCGAVRAQVAPEIRVQAAVAYVAFIVMYLLFQAVLRFTPKDGPKVSALDVVGACLIVKICMSACLYGQEIGWSPKELASETIRGSGTILRCGVPGVMYVLSDVMRAYALFGFDLAGFNAVFANRTIVTAVLWVALNGISLSNQKWVCLVLMSAGTALVHQGEAGTSAMPEARFYYCAWGAVFFSCLAAVVNERLLKTEPVRLNLQNLGTYCFGLAFLVGAAAAMPGSHVNPLVWFQGSWHSTMAIATLASLGIVTAHFLKLLSNLWKEVAIACQIVVAFAIEVLFGTGYTLMTGAGVGVVFLGMAGFAMDGVQDEAEKEPEKEAPEEHAPLVPRRAA